MKSRINFLTVVEARRPRTRCGHSWFPLKTLSLPEDGRLLAVSSPGQTWPEDTLHGGWAVTQFLAWVQANQVRGLANSLFESLNQADLYLVEFPGRQVSLTWCCWGAESVVEITSW